MALLRCPPPKAVIAITDTLQTSLVLETAILCCGTEEILGQQPISIMERMLKHARVPERAELALDCTFYVIMALFYRYTDSPYKVDYQFVVEKLRLELFHSKKAFPTSGCISNVIDIATLVSCFNLPYAFGANVVHQLSPDNIDE
jgi:hypothetical protein